MESSSEDSFAWTDASSDSSENGIMGKEEESDFDKSYKKKLKKELFQNGDHNEPEAEEPRVKKKKKIKREPSSPSPVKREANGHDAAAAEHCLRLKVKEEQASPRVSPAPPAPRKRPRSASPDHDAPRKKKHKRDRAERSPAPDSVDAEEPPKKKKKKRKREPSDSEDAVVDKFEAEETIVEERRPEPRPAPAAAPARAKPYTSGEFVQDDPSSGDEQTAPAAPARSSAPPPKKIKELITFEEEPEEQPETDAEAEIAPPPRAGRLGRYLRAQPQLRALPGAPPAAAALGPDDDVWLLHAPRGLDAAALAGAALTPGARCKVKAGGRQYEALPEPAAARAALLLRGAAGWRLRGVAVRGALRLRERVPRVRVPHSSPPEEPCAVPLPPTRLRHPLLGADYERALQPAAPAPRAQPTEPTEPRKEKKKKKKRDKTRRSTPPPEGAAVWDSERGIEESLFKY